MQPKVSVIIPAYNVGAYLDACLASLSAQTFGDFEAVVVNDGSSDDTEAIALRHAAADPRIRVISTPNGGVVAARARALREAQGVRITFLDGDDTWEPDLLERLVEAATDCDIVCCGYKRVTPAREKIVRGPRPCRMTGLEFFESLLSGRVWGGLWAKLYDRRIFDSELRHHPLPLWEDMILNVQIACASPCVRFIDYSGYRYLQRSGSASHGHFDFAYCRSFCETMAGELAARSAQIGGRHEFYATLNELRIYSVYVAGHRNPWNGDEPWVRDLNDRYDRYRRELRPFFSPSQRLLFRMNRRRALRPLVLAVARVVRWKESLVRRIAEFIR